MTLSTLLRALRPDSRIGDPVTTDDATGADAGSVLCRRVSARWSRLHRSATEVRSAEELALARAGGIHPRRLVVHAQDLCASDLLAAVDQAVGHVVVVSLAQVDVLLTVRAKAQSVLLQTVASSSDSGRGFSSAAASHILAHPPLRLAGLHGDIGAREGAFVSIPAAIGQMICELSGLRDRFGVTLTRLSVGVERDFAFSSGDLELHSPRIDDALRDACHMFDFPVPSVIVSAVATTPGRRAA